MIQTEADNRQNAPIDRKGSLATPPSSGDGSRTMLARSSAQSLSQKLTEGVSRGGSRTPTLPRQSAGSYSSCNRRVYRQRAGKDSRG
ncbi:hypothetical protein M407DRAFT_244592 [Tulasnella calospora MUT 4182]|uniref:Uncharacterized protein n=1 Tax=Tulasnella calospora MUT 4182 TaxID=1051891 RepID=A0A0C3LRL0_9AGAM|nr:hypothetical protein M407DRAFT_244592 [Tulasnella calospora MUT 4182]